MLVIKVSTELLKPGHVQFVDIGVVWNPPFGLLHVFGDPASQADYLDLIDPLRADAPRRSRGGPGTGPRSDISVELRITDAAGRSGSGDELQCNAKIIGTASDSRRGERPRPGRTGHGDWNFDC